MTSRFIPPFYDVGSGINPPSGAQLFFNITGTNTPKDTYTTVVANVLNTNPVVADAKGVFPDIYIKGDYWVTLKDKNGKQVYGGVPVSEFTTGDFNESLINDLSQEYIFSTELEFKNSEISFPDGKVITLLDNKASYLKVTGTGIANEINIIASTFFNDVSIDEIPSDSLEGNLLWQGSLNVWQRGFAFDDFTSRVGVMDGCSFSRAGPSDGEILVIQQADSARIQRLTGDTNTDACYLVLNMDHDQTEVIAGNGTFFKTSIRGNALTGPVSVRIQYTTYSDLQKITAFDGIYDVGHNELVTQVITPTSGVETFEVFDTILNIPSEAKQVSLVFIYEPTGTSPAEEWIEFLAVSNTVRPHSNVTTTPFGTGIEQAQRQYRKSYAYDSFPRTISNFGALSDSSKGTGTTSDSVLSESFDVSMLYAPTVTVRRPSGGGSGVDFTNETTGDNVVALVSITSSKGFRIEAAAKADAYTISDFTPVFGSVTAAYTKQDGRIIKDGDIASFYIDMEYNTLDLADTSDITIGGLLFGGADNDGMGNLTLNVNASTGFNLLVTDVIYPIILSTGGSSIAFTRSTGVNYDYNDGKMNAAGRILMSGSYKTSEIYGINTYSAQYEAEARL